MSAITTHTGVHFDPLHPDPNLIRIEDIAHALGNICRYGGHADHFYSVAQHSVLMARHVPDHLRAAALLHDAAEAYVGDMVRPLKHGTEIGRLFAEIEDRLLTTIFRRYSVDVLLLEEIEEWDRFMLTWEQRDLRWSTVEADGFWYGGYSLRIPDTTLEPWKPRDAKMHFEIECRRLFESGQLQMHVPVMV